MGQRTGSDQQAPPPYSEGPKSQIREYIETILVCVIVFIFLRGFVLQPSEIPSGSMEDAVLPGDYILVNRMIYAPTQFEWERRLLPVRDVERGDLVVFMQPDEPERDFIKRVIGMPGDVIELRQGYLHVDGLPVEEPYLNPLYRDRSDFGPFRVPDGAYLMFGDHRNRSLDSRAWGVVPRRLVKGRAFMILFSTAGPPEDETPGKVTLRSTARKLGYLVFRSRWDRALRVVR